MKAKSKGSRSGSAAQRLERRADPELDPVGDPGLLEVGRGDRGVLLGELAGDQPAAGREPAGDADRRVAGEGAELERLAGADQPGRAGS